MTAVDEEREHGLAWLSRALGLEDGTTPFPWQVELLRRFVRGDVVRALDIPTGLGKTATIAIWLVARALGAALPRRLVYVVDRRAIVDQATAVAEALRAWVGRETAVAEALGLGRRPLPISTLRGQHVDNREWLEDPCLPAIVVGTVDMIGSRLLFEGYRCTRRMRPYHAALLGADAMIVLDESHLVPAFEAMVRAVAEDERFKPHVDLRRIVPDSRVMSLSATGRVADGTLGLGAADEDHAVVKRRLSARKRVRFAAAMEAGRLAEHLASKAWELAEHGTRARRIVVFVDSRKTAQAVNEALQKLAKGDGAAARVPIDLELFVGGRRVAERDLAARKLAELGMIAGSKTASDKPVFLIATSAGEVGVDLDADHAVLDLVEWERMVQRLGRVNRRGDGDAEVWVVPSALDDKTQAALAKEERIRAQQRDDDDDDDEDDEDDDEAAEPADDSAAANKPPKRLKADERSRVLRWRRTEATQRAIRALPSLEGAYDACPRALALLRQKATDLVAAGSTPAPIHPELTRAVIEAWSMTSLEDHTGRPPVWPWLRGWVEEEAQTAVAWRAWLPRRADAKAFFEAAPIETVETLEVETTIVSEWLGKRVKEVARARSTARDRGESDATEQADTPPADQRPPLEPQDVVMFILDDRHRGWALGELVALDKKGRDDLFRELAGETIVVDVRLGGLDASGLLDAKAATATEVGGLGINRLPFRVREVDTPEPDSDERGWRIEAAFVSRTNDEGDPIAWLIVESDLALPATTADGRSTGREQRLDEHQAFAERHARRIAERIGLEPAHVELLAVATALHDEGKRADRWQRAFRAPVEKRPLAKTTSRPIQSILARYRHELGSLPLAERDPRVEALTPEDRDLVLHLIAAHHGYARPLLRTDGCDDAPPSALVERARAIALRFARLERRWGPWGLAWWETLLRAADQGASRENDQRGGARG